MYLLDTHAFLWFINDDIKLPGQTKDTIRKTDRLCISIGSFWEMVIKANIGKLKLPASISALMFACEEMQIDILQIAPSHLERLQRLPDYHGDPFDRLIISQAIEEGLTIMSADSKFERYGVSVMWK